MFKLLLNNNAEVFCSFLVVEGIASGKWEGDVAHCFPYIYMCLYVFICVSSRCRFRAPINSRSPIRRRLTGLPEADKVSTYLPKPYKSATDQ